MQVDWLTINPMSGGTGETSVYGYVLPNEKAGCTRRATVRFTNNEGLYADLNLSQTSDTSDMRFVVTPDYLFVQGGGGTFYVNVLTNTYWKITDYDSGLTITSDNQEGYGDGILTIVFPQNPNTNNQYGYDHQGRPFYGREGYITVTSLMGTKRIFWEQAAYEAITVTPNKLVFPQTGGTLSVTVKSSTDWEITSYDSAHTSFSALSGHSGETVISVTKSALTQSQLEYYSTCPSTAEFSDGSNVALLKLDSTIDDYYIDDDWITVTYNVPSANTEVLLFAHLTSDSITPTVQFQDDYHTGIDVAYTRIGTTSSDNRTLKQYVATFTTPGLHTIKMRFNKEGSIIPKWGFPTRLGFSPRGTVCYHSIVIGNQLSGYIEACAAINTGFKEVILGTGDITGIGEFAFLGCGSADKDFVLGNNVGPLTYEPFQNFTARKFVFNQDTLGGSGSSYEDRVVASGNTGIVISGVAYTFTANTDYGITATTNICDWSGYFGDITCSQFVIGDKVSKISNTPFYPFGFFYVTKPLSNVASAFTYGFAGASYGDAYPLKGSNISSIYCVPRVSPVVETYAFTPAVQTFKKRGQITGTYDFFQTFTKGPERNIPFHYPIGADYSAWSQNGWTNLIGDLNI